MGDIDSFESRCSVIGIAEELFIRFKADDQVSSNSELVSMAIVAARVFQDFANHYLETGTLKKVV